MYTKKSMKQKKKKKKNNLMQSRLRIDIARISTYLIILVNSRG